MKAEDAAANHHMTFTPEEGEAELAVLRRQLEALEVEV